MVLGTPRSWVWDTNHIKMASHMVYGDPYSEFVLCIYPSKVHTHCSEHTHTVNTHPEQWVAIYAVAPGEQLGVQCLAQGHLSHSIEGGQSAGHSLPPPTIPAGNAFSIYNAYKHQIKLLTKWLPECCWCSYHKDSLDKTTSPGTLTLSKF